MRVEDRAVIERLRLAGVTLSISLDTPEGCETVALNAEEALAYMGDPAMFSARHFGLCIAEYELWVASGGLERCAALTKAGRRCGNPVRGALSLSARQWATRQHGFCTLHERG